MDYKFATHADGSTLYGYTAQPANSASTYNFTAPKKYYILVNLDGCSIGATKGPTYSVEPETGAQWISMPAVEKVSPTTGSRKGGTTVTVTGSGFVDAKAVLFGSTKAKTWKVISATKITVRSPAHAAGKVGIIVMTPAGNSRSVKGDVFTYR